MPLKLGHVWVDTGLNSMKPFGDGFPLIIQYAARRWSILIDSLECQSEDAPPEVPLNAIVEADLFLSVCGAQTENI